jgi:ACS family hexuronate transporter-like MFS transporter
MKWRVALLVCLAIGISYLDRQSLPVAVNAIQRDIPLTNTQFGALGSVFLLAYALAYAGGGVLIDRLGTRRGFLVIMVFWSLACASHSLATSVWMLAGSRFLLGAGEGGGFPAATKVIAEWFPVGERSTAMGMVNAGTAIGAVVGATRDRGDHHARELAMGVRSVRGNGPGVGPVVDDRVRENDSSSCRFP